MSQPLHVFQVTVVFVLICVIVAQADQFEWQRFEIDGRLAFTILPKPEKRRESMPWVMYAPTFDKRLPNERDEGWMISRFLDAGIAIAGVDVAESYGNPAGRAVYNKLYTHLTTGKPNFAKKACLLARSRGGLMLYNWAAENPDKVNCIAGIYPVCDLRSYPGLAKAHGAYGMTEIELANVLSKHNPVDRLASLARAKVPIFHIHGDEDKVVPLEANSGSVAVTYNKLGGQMQLIVPKGQGHNMWKGFFECQPLVDFVISQAVGKPRSSQPKHLFILSGQSNMQGHRPEEAFTPAVEKAFGDQNVIVVQDAMGGQPIRRWYKEWKSPAGEKPETTGDLYDRLMTKVNAATQQQKLKSITFLWMQGERDAKEKLASVYATSLKGIVEQLRDDLKRDDINVVIGRLSDFDMQNKKYEHWTKIRAVQVEVAESIIRGAWVDTDDLNDGLNRKGKQIKDDLHYSAGGYKTLGKRFAQKAIDLIRANER